MVDSQRKQHILHAFKPVQIDPHASAYLLQTHQSVVVGETCEMVQFGFDDVLLSRRKVVEQVFNRTNQRRSPALARPVKTVWRNNLLRREIAFQPIRR